MKKVYAVRHVYFEDLGILEPELKSHGYEVEYLDAPTTDFDNYDPLACDLLVVLGAPIGAGDEASYPFLAKEQAFIKTRLDKAKPLLGICLGAQLIARLLGAKVYSMGVKEIGFAPITLTPAGETSPLIHLKDVPVLHWHGDQFEIPQGTERLARTAVCPNQAFTRGLDTLCLQFHVEANPDKIEQWLVGHACELDHAHIDPRVIREAARANGEKLRLAGLAAFRAWLELLGL